MWVDAGFDPDTFWHQTPATFQLVMQGVRKRMERDFETSLSLAWHNAAFTGATQSKGGLKPLRHYLRKPQSPGEMVAMLKTMGAKSDMKVRRVPRKK